MCHLSLQFIQFIHYYHALQNLQGSLGLPSTSSNYIWHKPLTRHLQKHHPHLLTNPTSLNTSPSLASCRRCQKYNDVQILFIYTSGSFYPKLLTLYSDSAFDQVLHSLGIMTLALAAQRRALLVELQQHTIVHSAL